MLQKRKKRKMISDKKENRGKTNRVIPNNGASGKTAAKNEM
jgi:hypothetical protein